MGLGLGLESSGPATCVLSPAATTRYPPWKSLQGSEAETTVSDVSPRTDRCFRREDGPGPPFGHCPPPFSPCAPAGPPTSTVIPSHRNPGP